MADTAKTSQKLADALRAAGFVELAARAEANEFHDYLSPHDMPAALLDHALYFLASDTTLDDRTRLAAHHLRQRHHDGEFDADLAESDDWAASEEGKAVLGKLVEGR